MAHEIPEIADKLGVRDSHLRLHTDAFGQAAGYSDKL